MAQRKTCKSLRRSYTHSQTSPHSNNSYLQLHEFANPIFREAAEHELGRPWSKVPDLDRKVLGIWCGNSWGSGVFFQGSLINHSCLPNTSFAINTRLQKGTFRAVRGIAAGEELTLTYNCNVNSTKDTRQGELQSKWGFVCTCPACEDTESGRVHEERRARMDDVYERAIGHLWWSKWKDAVEAFRELAALQVSEGILVLELADTYVTRPIELLLVKLIALSYHAIAKACMRLPVPDLKMAAEYTEKKLEIDRYCAGEDGDDYETGLRALRSLRAAAEKEDVALLDDSAKWLDMPTVEEPDDEEEYK
jgi:hypothetical protein